MKKFFFFLSLVLVLCCAFSAFASEVDEPSFSKQKNLGKDRAGLQWYIVDFGSSPTGAYAIAREYYTSAGPKAETVNILSSRYRVPYERASALYFTEYRFEYTPDGAQYSEVSRVFYDKLGDEICAYRSGNRIFTPVIPNTVQSKGAAYAMWVVR